MGGGSTAMTPQTRTNSRCPRPPAFSRAPAPWFKLHPKAGTDRPQRGNGLDALANQSVALGDAVSAGGGATAHGAEEHRRRFASAGWIIFLLAVLAFLVIYPVLML